MWPLARAPFLASLRPKRRLHPGQYWAKLQLKTHGMDADLNCVQQPRAAVVAIRPKLAAMNGPMANTKWHKPITAQTRSGISWVPNESIKTPKPAPRHCQANHAQYKAGARPIALDD